MGGPRQASITELADRPHKLGSAVGIHIDPRIRLIIQSIREGQRNEVSPIIGVVAGVRGARHNAAAYLNDTKTATSYRCRTWCRRWRRGRARRRCRCGRGKRYISRSLNDHRHGSASLEEANGRIRGIRRLVRIKSEVIQGAKANRIGILIGRKRFAVPCDGGVARLVIVAPRRAAIASISLRTIMCPARLLNRRMEPNVRNVDSRSNRHAERLNPAIKVLIIQCILVVPDASSGSSNFVAHKPDAIASGGRFILSYRCTRPCHDSRLLPHGRTCAAKAEGLVGSGYIILTVRSVIVHIALVWMTLAPGTLVRHNVLCLGIIGCSRV